MPKFSCVHCGQHIDAPDKMSGAVIDCPTCKGAILVPGNAKTIPLEMHDEPASPGTDRGAGFFTKLSGIFGKKD